MKPADRYREYQKPLNLRERLYLPEIARGLSITLSHFFANLLFKKRYRVTQYPDELPPVAPRLRGRHRLTKREDGSPRCVACYMCALACPVNAIHIEAGELPRTIDDPQYIVDKYPVRYDLDITRCIYCGLCVDACPKDAIRMDTYLTSCVGYQRIVLSKEELLDPPASRHPVEKGRWDH